MAIYQARLESGHFEYEAYGETEGQALSLLQASIDAFAVRENLGLVGQAYARRYGFPEDVGVREIAVGFAYRDREVMSS